MNNLPYNISCSPEALSALQPSVLEAFTACAQAYMKSTQQRLEVTSAKRSLRHCASLMSAMSIEQLEGMYCKHGYPSYITQMKEAMKQQSRPLTEDEAYAILCNRSEGYVSSHLYGAAVDIASDGLKDKPLLLSLLEKQGFRTLDETDLGIRCIHATYKNIEPIIIKQ